MSHFKAKMHRNSIPGVCLSVRSFIRPSILCLDTVDESQRRRHGVTAAIAMDVVAVRVCRSVRLLDVVWHNQQHRATPHWRRQRCNLLMGHGPIREWINSGNYGISELQSLSVSCNLCKLCCELQTHWQWEAESSSWPSGKWPVTTAWKLQQLGLKSSIDAHHRIYYIYICLNFRNFLLKNSGISGMKKTSEIPEMQSLVV